MKITKLKILLLGTCLFWQVAFGYRIVINNQTNWTFDINAEDDHTGNWTSYLLPKTKATFVANGCLKKFIAQQESPWKPTINFLRKDWKPHKCDDNYFEIQDIGGGKYKVVHTDFPKSGPFEGTIGYPAYGAFTNIMYR